MADESHVRVSPSVLNFPPPLNRVIPAALILENVAGRYVSYKVKTTAPKRYVVRPNTGIIPPHESVEIQVMLHMSKDPPDGTASKDRFQVQTILLDNADGQKPTQFSIPELRSMWSNIANPEDIKKLKLKCTFLDEEGADAPSSAVAVGGPRTPVADVHTPMGARGSSSASADASNAAAALQQVQADNKRLRTAEQKLQAKIAALTHDLQQLRSAAPAAKSYGSGSKVTPLLVVLCILSFLLGYYFG